MPKIVINRTQKKAKYYVEDLGNGITLDMMVIPGGSFMMGSPEDELERSDSESPQHSANGNEYWNMPVVEFATSAKPSQWKLAQEMRSLNTQTSTEILC